MSDYSYDEMTRMQQDAFRRVQDMQSRANAQLKKSNQENVNHSIKPNADNNQHKHSPPKESTHKSGNSHEPNKPIHNETPIAKRGLGKGLGNVLSSLTKDSDKTMLMILMVLLMSENSEMELVLALAYILL